ncbi:hypothetical protein MMC08_008871 [Hypocenomyce scalaris]|nr:hypothetical protein [Hypocenomyce scalaris]
MGSRGPEVEDSANDIHVLVTGFGPFRDHAVNPSYLIASSLPPTLPSSSRPGVHIHPHPTPIDVAYKIVRAAIPRLLFPTPEPAFDIVVNLGLAAKGKFYALECLAHRDGYKSEDMAGETAEGDRFWEEEYGAPEILKTGFAGEDVLKRWKRGLTDEDVRLSSDAGRYLCDFIYYAGLVEYWRRDPEGHLPVVFLHVPGGNEEEDLERGRRVTLELIGALVDSRMAK